MPIKWADEPQPTSRIRWEPDAAPAAQVQPVAPVESKEDALRRKAQEDLAAGMGLGERLAVGFDRGVTRIGQALKQNVMQAEAALNDDPTEATPYRFLRAIARNQLGLSGGVSDAEAAKYSADLAEDEKRYQQGLGQDTAANVAEFVGGTAATLPLGGPSGKAGAGILRNAAQAAATSGAVSALTTPATGEGDFASQKAEQAAIGAAVGGGLSAGLQGAGKVAEEIGLGNLLRRGYNRLSAGANAKPAAIEGERLAQKHGIDLTPGQVSGSKTQLAAENMARQSIFTRDSVFETDMKIADQFNEAINKNLDSLAKNGGTTAEAGAAIKKSVDTTLDRLQRRRAKLAEQDFAEVDRLAKGAPFIEPNNYSDTLRRIIDENSIAPAGSDARGLADAAKELFESAGDNARANNAIKTRRYLSQIAGGQASLSGSAGQPMQRRAATMLLDALDRDIEAAGAVGGELGEALAKANSRYRAYSQKIEGVKQGPVGKILGKDLVDTEGKGFGSVAPEQIYEKFSKLPPQHIGVALKVLSPEAQQQIKRAYVQKALETAQMPTASGGATQASIRPAAFVSALQKNPQDKQRIAALFTPDERKELDELMKLGRRIADSTGRNTSETAVVSQTMGVLEKLRSLTLKGLSEVAGAALGTRELARVMADNGGRRALLRLRKLPAGSEEARKLAAYVGGLAAAKDDE